VALEATLSDPVVVVVELEDDEDALEVVFPVDDELLVEYEPFGEKAVK
jgi:hypothetical protein